MLSMFSKVVTEISHVQKGENVAERFPLTADQSVVYTIESLTCPQIESDGGMALEAG
jgi:hypothetical protein